jgi:aryl-alcohol dehydrogenase-like predicted oxidoreductase
MSPALKYYGTSVKNVHTLVSAFMAELRRLGVRRIGLYVSHHSYRQ